MNLLDRQAGDICGLTGNRTFDRGKEDRNRENTFFSTPAIVDALLKKYAGAGEETSAMMMEDWVSFNIDPTFNAVRDIRFNQYLPYEGHGSCACGLPTWTPSASTCDSYSTNGSFGGLLNRRLGLGFYKSLLYDRNATASMDILNDAIRQTRADSSVVQ